MKRPELWKLRREGWRIFEQLRRIVLSRLYDPVRQRLYDRKASAKLKITSGVEQLGPRVAALILFQPRGLAQSTFLTLDHLCAEGWSVVVVSNAPLSPADLAAVAARASVVIERPNQGYDFGGYREAVRYLDGVGHRAERLILMNDSTWFPLREGDDTLRRLEATGADMAGHIYKVESSEKRGRDHLESHLLMFGEKVLRHPAFAGFWRRYVMSDERTTTVERGEKGLTQTMLAADLRVEGLLSQERMVALFAALPDDSLAAAVKRVVHHREDSRALCEGLLIEAAKGQPWRDRFLVWVRAVLSNSRQHLISATFVDPAMQYGGLSFVKKANDRRHQLGRRAALRAAEEGRIAPFAPVVRAEIEKAVADWRPPFDWRRRPGDSEEDEL